MLNDDVIRFFQKVDTSGTCWLWRNYKNDDGYGVVRNRRLGRMDLAHRVVWEMVYGLIPEKLSVLHKCDVRHCVNPTHLFLGTHQDNMDDMVSKGRASRKARTNGVINGQAKLSETDILDIREYYGLGKALQKELARIYNIQQSQVSRIVTGARWNHVQEGLQ